MLPWAVRNLATGAIVGSTRFHDIVADIDRVEIGYTWYAKSWQRSHVNTSCKLLLLTHAFEQLGCKVVGLRTDKFNFASQRAIEALGAKKDGVIRHFGTRRDGSARDVVMYSILASEWPEVKLHLDAAARAARHARRRRKTHEATSGALVRASRCSRRRSELGGASRSRPTSCCSTARSSRSTPSRRCARRSRFATARSSALGSTAEIRRLAGPATRVVELGGRTVIPGLIDSHLHAVRAALSFSTEVNWIGARSLREALGRISAAAQRAGRPAAGSSSPAAGTSCSSRSAAGRRRPSSKPRRRTIPSTCSSATAGSS